MKNMLHKGLTLCTLLLVFSLTSAHAQLSTDTWDELLKAHVHKGKVDYKGFAKERQKLERYLMQISHTPPQDDWSEAERMAYWINAYNAFTIKAILDHYPVGSIMDIKPKGAENIWKSAFFRIGGMSHSLDQIENQILRKEFNDPRIHFAINCASISCPNLRAEAFHADHLSEQLEEQTHRFINDEGKNQLHSNNATLSPIFEWFKADFTKKGSLIAFINHYSAVQLSKNATITFGTYNWGLNE